MGILRDAYFADFDVEALGPESSVDEVEHVRPQQQLHDAFADEVVGGKHLVGPGAQQLGDGFLFAGAGDDLQVGPHPAGGEHDVEVVGVGGDRRDQSLGGLNARLAQAFFGGSGGDEHG